MPAGSGQLPVATGRAGVGFEMNESRHSLMMPSSAAEMYEALAQRAEPHHSIATIQVSISSPTSLEAYNLVTTTRCCHSQTNIMNERSSTSGGLIHWSTDRSRRRKLRRVIPSPVFPQNRVSNIPNRPRPPPIAYPSQIIGYFAFFCFCLSAFAVQIYSHFICSDLWVRNYTLCAAAAARHVTGVTASSFFKSVIYLWIGITLIDAIVG